MNLREVLYDSTDNQESYTFYRNIDYTNPSILGYIQLNGVQIVLYEDGTWTIWDTSGG